MNKQFCSILNAKEGEPLEGTAPEKDSVILFPAKRSQWHILNKSQVADEWTQIYSETLKPSVIKNPLLAFYLPAVTSSDEESKASYFSQQSRLEVYRQNNNNAMQKPVLIMAACTDGRKDACCAKFGLPIYRELSRLAQFNKSLLALECSHIGGCRFAATLLCLPSGNVYGRVNRKDLSRLVDLEISGSILPDFYRGNVYATELECWIMKVSAHRFGYFPTLAEISVSPITDSQNLHIHIARHGGSFNFALSQQTLKYRLYSGCRNINDNRTVDRTLYKLVDR